MILSLSTCPLSPSWLLLPPPSQASPFIDSEDVNIKLVPPCNVSPVTTGQLLAATSGISTVKPLSLMKKIEEM